MQPIRGTRPSRNRAAAAWLTILMATAFLVALPAPPASSWFPTSVQGKVIFNNGAPAPGATVRVDDSFSLSTTTDAAGNFYIGDLRSGEHEISVVTTDGCAQWVAFPIRTSELTVEIRMPPVLDRFGHYCRSTPSPYLEAADQWDLGDNGSATVGMPFAFPFYGQSYATAYVSANGFVSFVPLPGSSDTNRWLGHPDTPKAAVLPFWDDLRLEGTTGVYTGMSGFAPNRRFTIEWRDIILAADAAEGRRIDFEVALYENGAIEFHYRNIDPANHHEKGSFATVGLTDPTGTDYFTYKHDTVSYPVADNQPIRFDLAPKCDGVPATVWGALPLNGLPLRDVIVGSDGPEAINGGGGDDLICAGGGDDQVRGENGPASLPSTGSDTIFGGDGNDSVDGDLGAGTIDGGSGHDTILGSDAGSTLRGGAGNDTLTGREGDDSVAGGDGDDILVQSSFSWAGGADGADVLDGGTGTDEVHYLTRTTPVTIDLADPVGNGAAGENDQIFGVENARGGSAGDTITGDGGTNLLFGGAGVDTLVGGDGADFLYDGSGADAVDGGLGNDVLSQGGGTDAGDVLDGGADTDEIRYSARSTPLTITLANDLPDDGAPGEGDHVRGIEDARGGSASDVLSGTVGPNRLLGFAGDDTISGLAGDDLLSGGDGDDVLHDGAGSDAAHGQGGADVLHQDAAVDAGDVLDGGPDTDEIRYTARTGPVRLHLSGTTADDGATGENDQLLGIENARGGAGGDSMQGGSGDNTFHGNAGNDVVNGGGGADALYDGPGADTVDGQTGEDLLSQTASVDPGDVLDGGAGSDEVRYTARSTAVTITLAGAADDGAAGENDQLLGIEHAQGGSAGDIVSGSAGNNRLHGNGGDDALSGGDGADTLYDGAGADTASGQAGNDLLTQPATSDPGDVLDGGEGTDEVRYTARTTPVTLDLANNTADDGAPDEHDQLLAFEIVHGGSAGDTITGSASSDRLYGNAGSDTVDGLDGRDFLYDGPGADTVQGGTGNDVVVQGASADNGDVLDGGANTDEVRYTARTTPVTIGLANPAADDGAVGEGDQLLAFENAQGGAVSDSITGTAGPNRLYGGTGNDTIDGLEGNDVLYDGPGADTVQGGAGNDIVVQGASADNGDVLDGGADTDEIRYSARTSMVQVSLFNASADDGAPGEGDQVLGIENAVGGSAVDHLAGNDGPNRLVGGAGPDLVAGFGGDDHVDIADGIGHDQADGGPGTDTVAADPGDIIVGFNP